MQPDDIDKLFRESLHGHRTPPPRALWERLEDELHPPKAKKRPVAWWPMALAASVLLLVLAGGGFWNGWLRPGRTPELAGRSQSAASSSGSTTPATPALPARVATAPEAANSAAAKTRRAADTGPLVAARPAKAGDARRPALPAAVRAPGQSQLARAATVATVAAKAQAPAARGERGAASVLTQRVRAASRPEAEVAVADLKKIPAGRATRPAPAASTPLNAGPRARQPEKPLTAALTSEPQPAAPAVLAKVAITPAAPSALASPAAVIEVDVRRGGSPELARLAGPPVTTTNPAEATASPGRRRLMGRLGRQFDGVLGQADRVVRTARQSLTSLPNVTVEAHLGERTVSKTLAL